jgi:hemerythrin-like domain-containing protein
VGGKSARNGTGRRDDGLDMMERSHRRLEERMVELQRAAEAIVRERADAGQLAQVDEVIAFLERSAARHESDEEESLFPRLRGHAELVSLMSDLAHEHDQHRQLVAQLRALRSGWPPGGPDAGDGAALAIAVSELARAYRIHIEREERELLPFARDRLTADDRAQLGLEMERRRNGDGSGRGGGHRRRPAGSAGPRIREL